LPFSCTSKLRFLEAQSMLWILHSHPLLNKQKSSSCPTTVLKTSVLILFICNEVDHCFFETFPLAFGSSSFLDSSPNYLAIFSVPFFGSNLFYKSCFSPILCPEALCFSSPPSASLYFNLVFWPVYLCISESLRNTC
jgi:hypothetical protein